MAKKPLSTQLLEIAWLCTLPNHARVSRAKDRSKVHHSHQATVPSISVRLINRNLSAMATECTLLASLNFLPSVLSATAKLECKHNLLKIFGVSTLVFYFIFYWVLLSHSLSVCFSLSPSIPLSLSLSLSLCVYFQTTNLTLSHLDRPVLN